MPPDTPRQQKAAESALSYFEIMSNMVLGTASQSDIDLIATGPWLAKNEEPEKPKNEAKQYVYRIISKRFIPLEHSVHEFRLASSWPRVEQSGQRYTPINISDSLDALKKDMVQVKDSMDSIQTRLSSIERQLAKLGELEGSLKALAKLLDAMGNEDFGWLKLSEQSFDFWDNPEDAIYDSL